VHAASLSGVGSSNRNQRAARQQARDRRRQRAAGYVDARSLDVSAITARLWAAANDLFRGDREVVGFEAGVLADADDSRLGQAVADVLARLLGWLWPNGWLPYDVVQIVRRELDEFAVGLIIDAIATDMARHPAPTVHERWREQLSQIDAVQWWDRDRRHFGQWLGKHILTVAEGLEVVIALLGDLMALGKLPLILPLPGTAAPAVVPGSAHVDQKVLARVRGLLAKAESTQFPEEAEALSTRAQELMNRHAFERALVDADEHVTQLASSRRIWLETPYIGAKAQLVNVVAKANRCRAVVYDKPGFVALLGTDLDMEITELLATSLLLQATRAMVVAGSTAPKDGESRSRTYRQSFLLAYSTRIGERLRQAADVGAELVDDARLLPVLADRERAVTQLFDSMFPKTVAKSFSVGSLAGWRDGKAAADLADLGVDRPELSRPSR
jgi:Protein of unknown function (DUF2786)